jgi:hypothetical protein
MIVIDKEQFGGNEVCVLGLDSERMAISEMQTNSTLAILPVKSSATGFISTFVQGLFQNNSKNCIDLAI